MDDDWGYPYFRKPPYNTQIQTNLKISDRTSTRTYSIFHPAMFIACCAGLPHDTVSHQLRVLLCALAAFKSKLPRSTGLPHVTG